MAIAFWQKSLATLFGKEIPADEKKSDEKIELPASIFGCWHSQISRPFMAGKTFYRTCLKCGARRNFNPETRKNEGRFYYPPVDKIG
jgi:hypothetical protein